MDDYLYDCEKQFKVEYFKRLNGTALSAWEGAMESLNATFTPRGKNTILECLQFGGNRPCFLRKLMVGYKPPLSICMLPYYLPKSIEELFGKRSGNETHLQCAKSTLL